MKKTHTFLAILGAAVATLLLAAADGRSAERDSRTWLEALRKF
jgi:hypothetical protein